MCVDSLRDCADSADALSSLGYSVGPSRQLFAAAARGPAAEIGVAALAIGVIAALMLLGLSIFWLLISLGEVITAAGKRCAARLRAC